MSKPRSDSKWPRRSSTTVAASSARVAKATCPATANRTDDGSGGATVTTNAATQAPAVIPMARSGSTVVASARLHAVSPSEGSSQAAAPQPSRGSARVYVDGVLETTVSMYKSTGQSRQVRFVKSFGSVGTHALKVVVVGTPGHPRVDVDAFYVSK